ncbi:dienelactone hydrolase [Dissoconium aciculare CBS 342.82]|jgi:pimeloyl-ACP methyl ester carboxylesterase|uniref:Dienelactone hydrolase n=1 Tax=Dissoconium aciculare CBS 342.82 TaxID=1314786 RepID=A0A6J3MGN0_9PEZI|nr:dienelactone hydrolase [Dissoconium aciculare CBS 342.82]KAF1827028.1 dienelactone hydrolase [Dissoconium aciculare CBS 342.82]
MPAIKTLLTTALAAGAALAQERITFTSGGTEIVGYHWAPSDVSTLAPVVIIAHGLGGLQTSRLQPYAERFSAIGYHAITFDYRYWGQSQGYPRNIIDVKSQQEDYSAAADYVGNLTGADPSRVVLWGTSLSGGHVLELGARLPKLAAVIAQVPHVNGLATVGQLPPASLPGLIAAGLSDSGRALTNSTPLYVPTANRTGEFGALTQAGAYEGYQFIQANPPAPGNVFPARFVLQLPTFSPDTTAYKSTHPTFIGIGLTDNVVSPNATLALSRRFKTATVRNYTLAGHFDIYPTKPYYEQNVADQIAFLQANVPV